MDIESYAGDIPFLEPYGGLQGALRGSQGPLGLVGRDITWRNKGVYSDDDIDEAGRRLCSLGADIQSRSTPGDRL